MQQGTKKWNSPVLDVITFDNTDVITSSGGTQQTSMSWNWTDDSFTQSRLNTFIENDED